MCMDNKDGCLATGGRGGERKGEEEGEGGKGLFEVFNEVFFTMVSSKSIFKILILRIVFKSYLPITVVGRYEMSVVM